MRTALAVAVVAAVMVLAVNARALMAWAADALGPVLGPVACVVIVGPALLFGGVVAVGAAAELRERARRR